MRHLKLFFLFSRFSLKTTFQARFGILLFIAGKIARFLFLLALIYIVFGRVSSIKGYSLDQVIIFFLTFNLVDTLSQILFREVYRFRYLVTSGSLDQILIKPYHPFVRVLIGGVDFLDLIVFFPYLALTAWYMTQAGGLTYGGILLYALLVGNAFIIAAAFHILALAVGILTTEVDHTMMIYRDLTSMGRFPMAIYQEPVKTIFTFIIPIGVMMTFPAQALFGLLTAKHMVAAFVLSSSLFGLSLFIWNRALREYQSWGG